LALSSGDGTPRWIEPVESLDSGEYILGGVTSLHLARGRGTGYGVYLTTKRIIGIKRKWTRLLFLPIDAGLFLFVIFGTFKFHLDLDPLIGLLFVFLLPGVDYANRRTTSWLGGRILDRADRDIPQQLSRRWDFHAQRAEILYIETIRVSEKKQTFEIFFNDPKRKPITIKISGIEQYSILTRLLEKFSRIEPAVMLRQF